MTSKRFTWDSRGKTVGGVFLILLLTLLVYFPALQGGFIWDDFRLVAHNRLLRAPDGLWSIWFSTQQADYFPLTATSFWLEWRLWGMNPTGYHVTNVLLHGLGAVLLWRVLLRLRIPGAWFAALVFAVHPVCVASVAWIAERKNTLSLVFFLLSILWYLRFEDPIGPRSSAIGHRKWYGLSLFAFLLALLSKTTVVILPLVLWLCGWWQRSQNAGGTFGKLLVDARRLAPFFILALVLGLVTLWFQGLRASENLRELGMAAGERDTSFFWVLHASEADVISDSLVVRLLAGSWAVWFYLGKAVFPIQLSAIYPRWEIVPSSFVAYVPGVLWVGLMWFCWRNRRRWGGPCFFALGYFTVALLPVLGFFNTSFFSYARVADQWAYLALMGVIALVVGTAAQWVEQKMGRGDRYPLFVMLTVVAFLSILTWRQSGVYASASAYWQDTLRKNPRAWVAHENYGNILAAENRFDEAAFHFRAAIQLKPNCANALQGLGMIAVLQGQMKEALAHFEAALRFKPVFPQVHNQLGMALARQGRLEEAITHFDHALKQGADPTEMNLNLGKACLAQGKVDAAIEHFRTALRGRPDLTDALNNLAWILATHPEARFRDGAEAARLAEQAAALTRRRDAEMLDTLAAAYAEAGRFSNAVVTAEAAITTATAAGQGELARQIEARLKSYQGNQPWRAP